MSAVQHGATPVPGAEAPGATPVPGAEAPIAVLVNPAAGRGRRRAEVIAALGALRDCGRPVRVLDADSVEAASREAAAAVAGGCSALVAIGGDGTLHLAVQAVAGTGVPLGLVPAGTGNDFASELGLPRNLVDSVSVLTRALAEGRHRPVDLARLHGPDGYRRWFAAVLGAGFDAIVNERANAMRWPHGNARYDLATYAELVRLRPRLYRITVDGAVHEVRAVLVAVGNTASYGGGMRICPTADATDGLLDVVIAGAISRTTLVRLKPRVYKGTHVRHPKVTSLRGRQVTIDTEGITAYADGERTCPLPITITAEPGALLLLS